MLLLGAVEAATGSFERPPFRQSPNIWWPQDRAWFVATEIDYAWTCVGGSEACIGDILDDGPLETFAKLDQRAGGRRAG